MDKRSPDFQKSCEISKPSKKESSWHTFFYKVFILALVQEMESSQVHSIVSAASCVAIVVGDLNEPS